MYRKEEFTPIEINTLYGLVGGTSYYDLGKAVNFMRHINMDQPLVGDVLGYQQYHNLYKKIQNMVDNDVHE